MKILHIGIASHFTDKMLYQDNILAELNAKGETPVIFGLLTCDTQLQAEERAGGRLGNKGSECAVAALKMANIEK